MMNAFMVFLSGGDVSGFGYAAGSYDAECDVVGFLASIADVNRSDRLDMTIIIFVGGKWMAVLSRALVFGNEMLQCRLA
jgi:hypothetical protein